MQLPSTIIINPTIPKSSRIGKKVHLSNFGKFETVLQYHSKNNKHEYGRNVGAFRNTVEEKREYDDQRYFNDEIIRRNDFHGYSVLKVKLVSMPCAVKKATRSSVVAPFSSVYCNLSIPVLSVDLTVGT